MFSINELIEATKGKLIGKVEILTIKGISIDTRTILPQDAFIAIKGNNFDGHDFIDEAIRKGAGCIISEPARKAQGSAGKVTFIEVRDTIKALGDIARFQRRRFGIPVIAVTGSNGKTTVKEMIAHTLSKRFKILRNEGTKNNHIGLPLTLLNLNSTHDIAVLEIGTNHFGEVRYLSGVCQPNIGIITNIGPSHLEYLRDLEGVFREKYSMLEGLKSPRIAILNADDDLLRKKALIKSGKEIFFSFGIKSRCDFSASAARNLDDKIKFRVNKKYKFTLNTPGYYNIYNALAAIAVARIFGIGHKDIISRLNTFDFPQGRLKILELNSIKFIDDTYNSNPLSLQQALKALANFRTRGRKIFVMGDMLELGSRAEPLHHQAGRDIAACCDVLITVGNLSRLAAEAARACRFDAKNIFSCENCRQAREILFNKLSLEKGDLVLVKGSRSMKMEEVFKKG